MADEFAFSSEQIGKIAAHVRRGKNVDPKIVLSPVVQDPNQPDSDKPEWYFIIGSAVNNRARLDRISTSARELAEEIRGRLASVLIQSNPPIALIDSDDELEMARACAASWPSPRTRNFVADLEAEMSSRNRSEARDLPTRGTGTH